MIDRITSQSNARLLAMQDKLVPHLPARWVSFSVLLALLVTRIYVVQGYFVVLYAFGIYALNLLIAFLTPVDVESGPLLPTSDTTEFKPYTRRLPEYKFW